ncbi:MAG TPA: hypothetical protein PK771_13975 [Spirochaetota bacterium]|nr:hypothetical protein [Spirochaetota bacterium]
MEGIKININVKDLIESNPELDVKELVNKIIKLSESNEEQSKEEFDQEKVIEVIKAINNIYLGKETYLKVLSFEYKDMANLKIYLKLPVENMIEVMRRMKELKLEVLAITNDPNYNSALYCLSLRRKN